MFDSTWTRIGGGRRTLEDAIRVRPRILRIGAAAISDLWPLVGSSVEALELNFTFVEDLSPLLQMDGLRRLRLFGNPLSPIAYHEQLPALRRKIAIVESSTPKEWELARQVWDAGVRLCYGRTPRRAMMLVEPGEERVRQVDLSPLTCAELLSRGAEALWAGGWADPASDPDIELYLCPYETGTAADAREWIRAAEILPVEREGYARLLDRFPDQLFFRDHAIAIDRFETRHDVRVPAWLRRARVEALAGVAPQRARLKVQFDDVPDSYEVGLLGSDNDERALVERSICHVLPVGQMISDSSRESTLAVRLSDDSDTRVFEYAGAEGLAERLRTGYQPDPLKRPLFHSWASLLGSISSIELDGVQIVAQSHQK